MLCLVSATMGASSSKKEKRGSNKIRGKSVIPRFRVEVEDEKKQATMKWYLLLAVIMAVTLLSYANSLTNQFVFDDVHVILNNRNIRGIEKIPRLLGLWEKRIISYRPIRMISYSVDYTLNRKLWGSAGGYQGDDKGLNPFGYHIANLFYHMVTSFLVFLIVYRLVANYRIAFLTAALFALHPVHTDSVTYLSGRRDILYTLFYLAGFYCISIIPYRKV